MVTNIMAVTYIWNLFLIKHYWLHIHVAMVTKLQMLAYFLNLLSIEHYLVQFWVNFGASTVNIKCMSILQTFRQSQNESKFQPNSSIF